MVRPTFALILILAACDKPTSERIDRWPSASDGVAKLQKAFHTKELDAELRARAAAHLVTLGETDSVMRDLAASKEPALMAPLMRFLSSDAEVADPLQVPTPSQVAAKDALFDLRKMANADEKETIDAFLAGWLAAYYDGRAPLGRHPGEQIVVALGSDAAPQLITEFLDLLNTPANPDGSFTPISDDLLRGLSLSGGRGLAAVLDIAEKKVGADHPDATLSSRALNAISYALSAGRQDKRVIVPLLDRLKEIAANTSAPPALSNMAFDLIAYTGKPICLKVFADLAQHKEDIRAIMALRKGIECAGADGIIPMSEALDPDRDVDFEAIESYFWEPIAKLGAPAAPRARTLLSSRNWLARLTGVKVLRHVGDRSDIPRLRSLEGDKAPLRGKPGKDTKRAATTVGGEAQLVADQLEKNQ